MPLACEGRGCGAGSGPGPALALTLTRPDRTHSNITLVTHEFRVATTPQGANHDISHQMCLRFLKTCRTCQYLPFAAAEAVVVGLLPCTTPESMLCRGERENRIVGVGCTFAE